MHLSHAEEARGEPSDGDEPEANRSSSPSVAARGHDDDVVHELGAATARHDEDVFGLQQVNQVYFRDLIYARSCRELLQSYLKQYETASRLLPVGWCQPRVVHI